MKMKAGHYLLLALFLTFNGCDMFDGLFKSPATITIKNDTSREIASVEVLLGSEVRTVDTNNLKPSQSQIYRVNRKSVYTVDIRFTDGSSCSRWADVTNSEEAVVVLNENHAFQGIALSMR
jgi:hypothetical protein